MTHVWIEEVVGDHRVEEGPSDLDAVGAEHLEVVLQILSYLEETLTSKEGAELLQEGASLLGVGRHIEVISLLGI